MRVLIVSSSFPPTIGGAETYAADVSRGLTELGHEVVVATDVPHGRSADASFADPDRVAVRRLHAYRDALDDPSKIRWEQMAFGLLPELAACAAEARPDLVLTNSLDAAQLGKVLALEYELPWAAAFHEHAPEQEPLGRGRLRLVYGTLRPSLVLAGSEFYAARARRWGAGAEVRLIYHGIDTDAFRPEVDGSAERDRYGVGPEDLLVVCAGRLKPRKGMRELVGALYLVRRRERRARLLIVGSTSSASPEYAALLEEDVARLGLEEAVTIDRSVTFDRMPAVLAAADVVAQPSREEGLGLSVLEAMSSARPTVTTEVAGVREVLAGEPVALVVPPGEPAPIAAGISSLLGDAGLRARLGAAAREHVVARFSRRLMLTQTEAALHGMVEAHHGREQSHV